MMMIDPLDTLAFSMHSNPGVYALLLGSGVSRSAGIPTGWEITLDLIEKLAASRGQKTDGNAEKWYGDTLGQAPDYSVLLCELAKTETERQGILRKYFEPTDDERERGLKVPSAAHKAIAELMAKDYVRVVLTTNFDPLLEEALSAVGVRPTVVSTPDGIKGLQPLTHADKVIVKLNGDYRDTRIKNTPSELGIYDPAVNGFLDRVLDEFGLVVCGWSAEYDVALRAAIERCPSRRFTTYWTKRGDFSEKARTLIELRKAQVIPISDADEFSSKLRDKIMILAETARPHPLSVEMAVSAVKRYVLDPQGRGRLEDLLREETKHLLGLISPNVLPLPTSRDMQEDYGRRLLLYEGATEKLACMLAVGANYGTHDHDRYWIQAIEEVGRTRVVEGGRTAFIRLRAYPAMLMLSAASIGAITGYRPGLFLALHLNPLVYREATNGRAPTIHSLAPDSILDSVAINLLLKPDPGRRFQVPISVYLSRVLKPVVMRLFSSEVAYQETFNKLEFYRALLWLDQEIPHGDPKNFPNKDLYEKLQGPIGQFCWADEDLFEKTKAEVAQQSDKWPLLQAGLCGGNPSRLMTLIEGFKRHLNDAVPFLNHFRGPS